MGLRTRFSRKTTLPTKPLGRDFSIFWLGQAVSFLGTTFTQFGLPLVVFKLTGSALNLAFGELSVFLPYVLFGLLVGAWVDRMDRRKMLVWSNLLRGGLIALIPLLATFQLLSVYWIYAISFLSSVLGIFAQSGRTVLIPTLVEKDQIVVANARLSITDAFGRIIGPVTAGFVISIAPIETVFLVDALSFVFVAVTYLLIKANFNPDKSGEEAKEKNVVREIKEGLAFLRGQPVLLSAISLATTVNFLATTVAAQQVLLAKDQFKASDTEVSLFFGAGGVGAVLFSFVVSRLPKSWGFGRVAIGSMAGFGMMVLLLGSIQYLPLALLIIVLYSGCSVIFNVQITSLLQTSIPNHLLGRVSSTGLVLSFAAIPPGTLAGGALIEWTGNIGLVYQILGGLIIMSALAFIFTPLSQARNTTAVQETNTQPG